MKDQFFTKADVVRECVSSIKNIDSYSLIIEPSAGNGAFLNFLPNRTISFDIYPLDKRITEKDFFTYYPDSSIAGKIIVVGNPPFGKNAALAVKFFNYSASFADTIAFILPRTFRKHSIKNKLDLHFHLDYEQILKPNSFLLPNNTEYAVSCVWQIWSLKSNKRHKHHEPVKIDDFSFVDYSKADFMFQRVGENAGLCSKEINKSPQSHYFIRENINGVFNILNNINWNTDSNKYDTVSNPSISKGELIKLYLKEKNERQNNSNSKINSNSRIP
jgi:hypothetical protein